ncbi:hypothetical protein CHU_3636 [Cytophaga hutchinsonii ATCC 33406]|uniref:Uncharacterized protein n=1 Tax=Cytophaga hutchinsonii (strain ATCC 33406 / DSM 1761 / CIP 103989 / NBRC 15051 / NCIMB 9469 / D465) TaxID=269798 RepID=A0A6N4SWD6_CYTH3|nr:hypothetical protein CHU_3636 [Cytophaga hutchinsonii ATCC 33406]
MSGFFINVLRLILFVMIRKPFYIGHTINKTCYEKIGIHWIFMQYYFDSQLYQPEKEIGKDAYRGYNC